MRQNALKIIFIIAIAGLFNITGAGTATSSPAVIAPYSKTVAEAKAAVSYSAMINNSSFLGMHTGSNGLTYEITKVNTFPRGVEIFARAWKNGKQLGLGFDGTTDIERFQIHEPTGLVSDPQGLIIQSFDEPAVRYSYDPLKNLLDDMEHAILLTGKTDTKIVAGSIGHTTSTYYPQSGSGGGNTTMDGTVYNEQVASWSTIVNASTGSGGSDVNKVATGAALARANNEGGGLFQNVRGYFTFDTSDISTDSISSAILSFYGFGSTNTDSSSVNVVASTQTNANDLASADYSKVGSTVFASMAIASWSTSGYNDFTLDSNGKANINKTGVSKFSLRNSLDISNTQPSGDNYVQTYMADNGSSVPKLVVVHTAGDPPPADGTFPFTPKMNFGLAVNATTTPIWFQAGLMSSSTNPVWIQNITDTTANQVASFYANMRATPTANDQGYLSFYGSATGAGQQEFSRILWEMNNVGNTTKNSTLRFYNQVNNTLTEGMSLAGTNLNVNGDVKISGSIISDGDICIGTCQ